MKKRAPEQIIQARIIVHRGEQRIALKFKFDADIIERIKMIEGRRYSKTNICWHIPNTTRSQQQLRSSGLKISWNKDIGPGHRVEHITVLSQESRGKLTQFKEYLTRQRYQASTIKSYVMIVTKFMVWRQRIKAVGFGNEILDQFNSECIVAAGFSRSYQNLWISAVKLFARKFEHMDIDIDHLERPRKMYNLPTVLSENEVRRLIDSYYNIKHKTIILMIYACGLRKSEILDLRLSDIDSDRMVVRIRNSKGAKDRDIALPEMVLDLLYRYYRKYRPKDFLIEGQYKGRYSSSSIDKILRNGLERIGKPRKITCHGLRHSYATHLVERNINLRFIQESLGHRSSKTTEIYTRLSKEHIAQMVSPVDYWGNRQKNKKEQ